MQSGEAMTDLQPGCIYLHIGPPKTATTSLQLVLEANQQEAGYDYRGVTQPRDPGEAELAARLHRYCVSPDDDLLRSLRNEVDGVLNTGRDLVISEEMLLRDGHVTHQDKLQRLSEPLKGARVIVLICVRDPVIGLQSLYQELFRELGLSQKLSFARFVRGNQAKVFDYAHVTQAAAILGGTRCLSFDSLTQGDLTFGDLLGPRYASLGPIVLPSANVGPYSGQSRRRAGRVNLGQVLAPSRWVPKRINASVERSPTFLRTWTALRSLSVFPERSLRIPESLAKDLRDKARSALA